MDVPGANDANVMLGLLSIHRLGLMNPVVSTEDSPSEMIHASLKGQNSRLKLKVWAYWASGLF